MENRNDPWLCLALLPGLNPRIQRAVEVLGLRDVLLRPEEHRVLLGPAACRSLATGEAWAAVAEARRRASTGGYRIVTRGEAAYPPLLHETFDPPPALWVRGRLIPGENRAVALVGSRAASPAGLALAREMASELSARGVCVVSGLARGIDAAAHAGALRGGGRTVAVLGSGIDRPYPAENTALLQAIVAAGGAVVSEFPPGAPPRREHFPRRNRVVAGWCRAVVVVEAGRRSGALITARLATDAGRDVLAVPAHPHHVAAAGSNALLRDGAGLVRDAADVLSEIDGPSWVAEPEAPPREVDPLLRALRGGRPMSVDELGTHSGIPTSRLLARLSELELAARVRRLPGNLYLES